MSSAYVGLVGNTGATGSTGDTPVDPTSPLGRILGQFGASKRASPTPTVATAAYTAAVSPASKADDLLVNTALVPTDRTESATDISQPTSAEESARFRFSGGAMDFGDVCSGWEPKDWAAELRRKAQCCSQVRPDIADYYTRWAQDIEQRLPRSPSEEWLRKPVNPS